MGLEIVELIMDVEDAFGIQIADQEASQIITIGELYQTILDKLKQARSGECMTAKAFYRLRRGLSELSAQPRRAIRPDTPLEALVPSHRRRRYWSDLSRLLGVRLPPLRRPGWVITSLMVTIVGLIFIAILGERIRFLPHPGVSWGLLVGLLLTAGVLTRPLATNMGPWHTTGDLARVLLRDNFATFAKESQFVNEKEVWDSLVAMIAEQLGVSERDLRPEVRFVEDLNVG
jgi:acyl carrier protein